MQQYPFNLTSFIVLIYILIIGLFFIHFFAVREKKREQKLMEKKFPSATRQYPKEVNDKLDIVDIKKYHQN